MASSVFMANGRRHVTPSESRTEYMGAAGKTQRLSKTYRANALPDHGPETLCESGSGRHYNGEGNSETRKFKSYGWRSYADPMASEDSPALKRSRGHSSTDRSDAVDVPLLVISLAKMSTSERRELKKKLKNELHQVQSIQKKIASGCSSGVTLSSSGDKPHIGPSLSATGKTKTRKKVGHVDSPKWSSKDTSKQLLTTKNGGELKRGPSGRFESVVSDENNVVHKDHSVMTQCENLLKRLMTHQFGWVFNAPVDVVKLKIPDYFQIIKHPMDLGTVRKSLTTGDYDSPHAFAADVRLTFSNAMTYNPPGNDVHFMADTLNKFFEVRWKAIEKKIAGENANTKMPATKAAARKTSMEVEASEMVASQQSKLLDGDKSSHPKKRRHPDSIAKVKEERTKPIMTEMEKVKLSKDLENLWGDMLERAVDFLRSHSNPSHNEEDEIEIDIDSLPDDVLWSLRGLLDDPLNKRQVHQQRADLVDVESTEVEMHASGISISLQHDKGNDAADEDVDIGGNDPPLSSYPPLEIEKDVAPRINKCSSSSICSSDSDSSTNSDSGSSSGSELDGLEAKSSPVTAQEKFSRTSTNHANSEKFQVDDGTCPVSELVRLEQISQSKTVSTVEDDHHEGKNAPLERQVSPEKLYRAALLKSRFADTILKAREKTFAQGDKEDPEKLRCQREELERNKKEERARLHAQGKAAEEARRQAEAVAAAEAKKKRELERQASRLALQKMEKTVEIDENCHFLKDLEMLQCGPLLEHLPSSVDETSPDHCEDVMAAGFKLSGVNPLEQLGLYRKDDVDDEDEILIDVTASGTALSDAGDVEEG